MKTNITLMTKINQALARIEDNKRQVRNLQEQRREIQDEMVMMILEDELMAHKIILNLPPTVLVNAIHKGERGQRVKQ